jgi:hypothetical protein
MCTLYSTQRSRGFETLTFDASVHDVDYLAEDRHVINILRYLIASIAGARAF